MRCLRILMERSLFIDEDHSSLKLGQCVHRIQQCNGASLLQAIPAEM